MLSFLMGYISATYLPGHRVAYLIEKPGRYYAWKATNWLSEKLAEVAE